MKQILITAGAVALLTAGHAQTAGLRLAGGYRIAGPLLRADNQFNYYAGAFYEQPFGKRLELATGLGYGFVRPEADPSLNPGMCGNEPDVQPVSGKTRYHVLEIPLAVSMRIAGAAQSGWQTYAQAGYTYGRALRATEQIYNRQTGLAQDVSRSAQTSTPSMQTLHAELELRRPHGRNTTAIGFSCR